MQGLQATFRNLQRISFIGHSMVRSSSPSTSATGFAAVVSQLQAVL